MRLNKKYFSKVFIIFIIILCNSANATRRARLMTFYEI